MPFPAETPTVWQAIDEWSRHLRPWQREILAYAAETGVLSDAQIDRVYGRFLEDVKLRSPTDIQEVKETAFRRPTEASAAPLHVVRLDNLAGVNAIPDGSALTFGPALTVIYGRNGAGKSGFARLFANACFSRHKPDILANIYETGATQTARAKFHAARGNDVVETFDFALGVEFPELRRISFFDTTTAKMRVSDTAPFEFKPAGFEIFPEMARVYGQIASRLEIDIRQHTHSATFAEAFIGPETEVSKAVRELGPNSDPVHLRALAAYGPQEQARFSELDAQLAALKAKSLQAAIATLRQAREDIGNLRSRLNHLALRFTAAEQDRRRGLVEEHSKTAAAAAAAGSDQFKRSFFAAVGSAEWQQFAKAAHALARKESASYPESGDHCLLCERPFDEASRDHVAALLSFVESDAQRQAELAMAASKAEIADLKRLDFNVCSTDSRVREHLHRIDPDAENAVTAEVAALIACRDATVGALDTGGVIPPPVELASAAEKLEQTLNRIKSDLERLEQDNSEQVIAGLETERQGIRHKEVLSQLLPSIEKFLESASWCRRAGEVRAHLNPRPVTEKEKQLFSQLIGDSYRTRLARECEALECIVPLELQTAGQKGKTVRSLSLKGGHRPEAILSEGEQKAVALADFLTEVGLNLANAGIVLDDPVTSQDHQRKELIAKRLVEEAKRRQVVVFTHDLVFLNQILVCADKDTVETEAHWIDRDSTGNPGQVKLHDAPATSKLYDTTERAKTCLAKAKSSTGTARDDAIRTGMGALRRTVEETVVKRLLKNIVPRWSDRVIVTALRHVAWDESLADELCHVFEQLSAYIEGHSHTEDAMGAPPQVSDLERMTERVDALIRRARQERKAG